MSDPDLQQLPNVLVVELKDVHLAGLKVIPGWAPREGGRWEWRSNQSILLNSDIRFNLAGEILKD